MNIFKDSATPLVRRLCLALAAVIIFQLFYLGSQPIAVGLIPEPWDKAAHFSVFGALTVLLWVGTAGRMPITVVLATVALGACDELHQVQLPGRTADLLDFLADVMGCTTARTAIYLYARTTIFNL